MQFVSAIRFREFVLALATILAATACEGETGCEGGEFQPDATIDTMPGASSDAEAGDSDVLVASDGRRPETDTLVGRLHFLREMGDDGQSCMDAERCVVMPEGPEVFDLAVRYTRGGIPVEGALLQYRIVDDEYGLAALDPGTGLATTDHDGVSGYTRLRVGFEGRALRSDDFAVEVSAPEEVDVRPIRFVVSIHTTPPPALSVFPDYIGEAPLETVSVWSFLWDDDRSRDDRGAAIDCASLDAVVRTQSVDALPNAVLVTSGLSFGRSATYSHAEVEAVLPTVADPMFTVLAVGFDSAGQPRALGCDDESAHVCLTCAPATTRFVHLPLEDL